MSQRIFEEAVKAFLFLRIQGFITDSEREKISKRLDKYRIKLETNVPRT